MSVASAIRQMLAAGLSVEQALTAAEIMEAEAQPQRTARQERNRRYYEAHKRSGKRLNASEQDVSDGSDEGHEQKVPTTLKTKQTNNNPPSSPTGTQTPRGVPAHRGTSLPDDWQPSEGHFVKAEGRSFDRDWVGEQARRMRDWALGNRNRPVARKADWDRTFHGWIDREMDRARPNGSRGPPIGHPDLNLDGLRAKIAERSARERATH